MLNVLSDGWVMLEHHFITVTADTQSTRAKHTPVLFFSTKTIFYLFKSFPSIFNILNYLAKVVFSNL